MLTAQYKGKQNDETISIYIGSPNNTLTRQTENHTDIYKSVNN